MTGYILSPGAKGDIREIWDYSARNWGADQAPAARNFILS